MIFPQKWYDALKWVALVVLPALSAFYFVLSAAWGFPFVQPVMATIAGTETLLGALLGISSAKYKNSDARFDGTLNVLQSDPSKIVNQLNVTTDPETVAKQGEMILKVNQVNIPLADHIQAELDDVNDMPLDSPPRS